MKVGEKLQELGYSDVMEMRAGALEIEFVEMVEEINHTGGKELIFDNDVVFFVSANTVL